MEKVTDLHNRFVLVWFSDFHRVELEIETDVLVFI